MNPTRDLNKYFLLLVAILTIKGPLLADIAPNPIFINGLIPSDSCKVQMKSEIINSWVYKDSSIVECEFILLNHSSHTTISVGFPIMSFYHWYPPENWKPEKDNFKVWVNDKLVTNYERYVPGFVSDYKSELDSLQEVWGEQYFNIVDSLKNIYPVCSRKDQERLNKKVDSIYDKLPEEERRRELLNKLDYLTDYSKTPWYLWEMDFDSLQTTKVRVRYSIPAGMGYGKKYQYFKYILQTGAGWYKEIQNVIVNVNILDFPLNKITKIEPAAYSVNGKKKLIKWELNNIEPSKNDNIYVEYSFTRDRFSFWYHKKFRFYFLRWFNPKYWISIIKENRELKKNCDQS
jgi:hypothetical protein